MTPSVPPPVDVVSPSAVRGVTLAKTHSFSAAVLVLPKPAPVVLVGSSTAAARASSATGAGTDEAAAPALPTAAAGKEVADTP